jgi:hypothetical protein
VQNSATGPTIAANLALVKKEAMRKENVISERQNEKKYINSSLGSDAGRKVTLARKVVERDIQKKRTRAVRNQLV